MLGDSVRVMVVDDHELVREGVCALLEREPDIRVVAQAKSGEEALAVIRGLNADVVILDHRLPGMSGAETCREILVHKPGIAVILLTSFETDDVIHQGLVAGARGFLTKGIDCDDLARAVRSVARGDAILAPSIAHRVIGWALQDKTGRLGSALSQREQEILSLVADGLTNGELAERLGVGVTTVKAGMQSAMRKLGVTRRWDAVAVAIERGAI